MTGNDKNDQYVEGGIDNVRPDKVSTRSRLLKKLKKSIQKARNKREADKAERERDAIEKSATIEN